MARHPRPPPGDPRLDALHRPARTTRWPGVVLLDLPDHDSTEVVAPPRGRPAGAARRHVRVGARPAEVRRRRDPRPLPRAARVAQGRDAGRPQPHRHRARGRVATACVADVRRLLEADGLAGVPGARPSAPATAWGIDELKKQIAEAGGREEGDPGPARRRRPRGRRAAPGGVRHGQGAHRCRPSAIAALDDAFADAAGVPTVVKAVEDSTRIRANRATGWPVDGVVLPAQARPAQAAPPRPRLRRQAAHRRRPDLRAPGDRRAAGARRHRGPRARRPGLRRHGPAVGHRDPQGLDLAAARPRRPARPGRVRPPTSAPTKIPMWAGLVRVLQWLLIIAAVVGGVWLALLAVRLPTRGCPSRRPPSWAGSRSPR